MFVIISYYTLFLVFISLAFIKPITDVQFFDKIMFYHSGCFSAEKRTRIRPIISELSIAEFNLISN